MMAMMKARVLAFAGGAWAASCLIALSAQTPASSSVPQATPADGLPDGEGKAAVVAVCEPCHGVTMLHGNFKTRLEWEETLEEMGNFGAKATDDQWTDISAYLLKHFSKVNVNKAAARDFELVLDVDTKLAEAIVNYRSEHGNFATLDDLKQVPGIDAQKLDARAKRLTF